MDMASFLLMMMMTFFLLLLPSNADKILDVHHHLSIVSRFLERQLVLWLFGMGLFNGKGTLGQGRHRAFAVICESRASDTMLRFYDTCQSYKVVLEEIEEESQNKPCNQKKN